jgi:hypothetical protein
MEHIDRYYDSKPTQPNEEREDECEHAYEPVPVYTPNQSKDLIQCTLCGRVINKKNLGKDK